MLIITKISHIVAISVLVFLSGTSRGGVLNDFDGDDDSDLAVYHPPTGQWFIRTLEGTVLEWRRQWGYQAAVPVPGDYNADGQADLAVYDRNGGYWYVLSRSGTVILWKFQWGWNTAVPVPGDYDGDGHSDLGVYDLNTGYWYVYSVAKQQVLHWRTQWGFKDSRSYDRPANSTVIPMPYDYDSDSIIDIAVYYRGLGMPDSKWYLNGSSGRIWWGVVWGSSGSIPAPGTYRNVFNEDEYPRGVTVYKVKNTPGAADDGTFNTPYMHHFSMGIYGRTLPVSAHDFDGNGWDDHAVYNYVTGAWVIFLNDADGNGTPQNGSIYQQPPRRDIPWGFNGAIPANIYSTIISACGYTLKPW